MPPIGIRVDHLQRVVEPLARRDRAAASAPRRASSPTVARGEADRRRRRLGRGCTSASAADASRAVSGSPETAPPSNRTRRAPAACACPPARPHRTPRRTRHPGRRRPSASAPTHRCRGPTGRSVGPLRHQHVHRVHAGLARAARRRPAGDDLVGATAQVGQHAEPGQPRQLAQQRRLRQADVEQRVPHRGSPSAASGSISQVSRYSRTSAAQVAAPSAASCAATKPSTYAGTWSPTAPRTIQSNVSASAGASRHRVRQPQQVAVRPAVALPVLHGLVGDRLGVLARCTSRRPRAAGHGPSHGTARRTPRTEQVRTRPGDLRQCGQRQLRRLRHGGCVGQREQRRLLLRGSAADRHLDDGADQVSGSVAAIRATTATLSLASSRGAV